MNIDPWIWTKQNALEKEFCKHLIDKFEQNADNQFEGLTVGGKSDFKRSTDLIVTNTPGWEKEQRILHNVLTVNLEKYLDHIARSFLPKEIIIDIKGQDREFYSNGHQMQKTVANDGYYHWHHDALSNSQYYRVLTYLFYLNDVKEGGETEFINGVKIKPQTGKLLIFPATTTYYHRGVQPVSNTKYISIGWMSAIPDDIRMGYVDKVEPEEMDPQDNSHYIDYTSPKESEDLSDTFFLS